MIIQGILRNKESCARRLYNTLNEVADDRTGNVGHTCTPSCWGQTQFVHIHDVIVIYWMKVKYEISTAICLATLTLTPTLYYEWIYFSVAMAVCWDDTQVCKILVNHPATHGQISWFQVCLLSGKRHHLFQQKKVCVYCATLGHKLSNCQINGSWTGSVHARFAVILKPIHHQMSSFVHTKFLLC